MGVRENSGVHRNGNGRIRKVKRKGDGEWASEGEKGRKGETILCGRFLCRLEYSAPSQCRTHGYRDHIYRAVVSFYAYEFPNFPYFSKGISSFVDRKMRLFVFSNGFASEIFLFVQFTMIILSNRSFELNETVTVGYNLSNIDT